MTFDDWMKTRNPRYDPTDDTVALRELRACWVAAQKVGVGGTARKIRRFRPPTEFEEMRGIAYDEPTDVCHQHTGRDFLRNFEATLRGQQEPLGEPFSSILAEHLDELYETEDKGSNYK